VTADQLMRDLVGLGARVTGAFAFFVFDFRFAFFVFDLLCTAATLSIAIGDTAVCVRGMGPPGTL
jgi:hypothetical protein